MNWPKPDNFLPLLLRGGTFLCFLGWAWVHLYWEGPLGALFWQDGTFRLAERLGISWEEFVGTGANDGIVQQWNARIGWLYLICAILALTVRKGARFQIGGLIIGSGLLTLMSYAKYVGAQRQLPMLIEHGGQMLMPLILILALTLGVRHRTTVAVVIVATIMIFAGHGAYALGYVWPTPANFVGMTTVILHVDSAIASIILKIAGVLDLLVCVGLFIPKLRRTSVLYAAIWGALTALARPVAGMSMGLNYWGADQFIHETVLRAPHFMIPLFLFFLWKKEQTTDVLSTSPQSDRLQSRPTNPQTSHP